MIKWLHDLGLRSEHAYAAGFASIALTFVNWAGSQLMHSDDKADRVGLFTGQWAPTLMITGVALAQYESTLDNREV